MSVYQDFRDTSNVQWWFENDIAQENGYCCLVFMVLATGEAIVKES